MVLPSNFFGNATVKCTIYNLTSGLAVSNSTKLVPIPGSTTPPPPCTSMHCGRFMGGYFDKMEMQWYDGCSVSARELREEYFQNNSEGICPGLSDRPKGAWISLIGDSVIREEFNRMPVMPGTKPRSWSTGKNSIFPDYLMKTLYTKGGKDIMTMIGAKWDQLPKIGASFST